MEAWLTLREACPCVLGTSCRRHHYEPQGRSWVKQSKAPRELPRLHNICSRLTEGANCHLARGSEHPIVCS